MEEITLEVGCRVSVINYCPFRGLKGTVKQVHVISDPDDEDFFCFYCIELDAAQVKEPVWFQDHEVELLESSSMLFAS